jgi:hypothetical protein
LGQGRTKNISKRKRIYYSCYYASENNVEVNVVTKTNEPLQSNSDEDIDLKKSCVNCEGYKKDLYNALKSKEVISDFCEKLQTRYKELNRDDDYKIKVD